MELTEQHFEDLSQIKYRIFTCDISGEQKASALILCFSGCYGFGSDGNQDGEFMRVITLSALSLWHVDAVVFDLRELSYEWGDKIWGMYGCSIEPSGIDDLPYVTIVSERCRTGFESCAVIVGPMFNDLESAFENLRPRVQAYLSELRSDAE